MGGGGYRRYGYYLIKREKCTRELTSICKRNPHTIVDLTQACISIPHSGKASLRLNRRKISRVGSTYEVRLWGSFNQYLSFSPHPRQRNRFPKAHDRKKDPPFSLAVSTC